MISYMLYEHKKTLLIFRFEQADIQEMLTELFLSLLKNVKEQS